MRRVLRKHLVEIIAWTTLLFASILFGCKDARELILKEDELLQRMREPWRFEEPLPELEETDERTGF
jgi:hypothetical protein